MYLARNVRCARTINSAASVRFQTPVFANFPVERNPPFDSFPLSPLCSWTDNLSFVSSTSNGPQQPSPQRGQCRLSASLWISVCWQSSVVTCHELRATRARLLPDVSLGFCFLHTDWQSVKNNTQVLINVRNNHKLLARIKAFDRHCNMCVPNVAEASSM